MQSHTGDNGAEQRNRSKTLTVHSYGEFHTHKPVFDQVITKNCNYRP